LVSTVYVPPRDEPFIDEDMARRLAMPEDFLFSLKAHASRDVQWRPYTRPKPLRDA
jgi:hypothetical protein